MLREIINRILSFLVIFFVIVVIGIKFFSWIHLIWNDFLARIAPFAPSASITIKFGACVGILGFIVIAIFLATGIGYLLIKFRDWIYWDDRIIEFDEDKGAFKALLIIVSIIFTFLFFLVK